MRKDYIMMQGTSFVARRMPAILVMAVLVLVSALSSGARGQDAVTITIAPKQFVIAYEGTKVTVHTNIPYGDAVNESIEMHNADGKSINPSGFGMDDRGYLVVKFLADDVEMIVTPPTEQLFMTGDFTAGGNFSATDVIRVK